MVTENVAAAKNGEKTHLVGRRGGDGVLVDADLRPANTCLRPGAEHNGNKTDMLLVLKRCDAVSL